MTETMLPHEGLRPYRQCPRGTPGECTFGEAPEVALDGMPGPYPSAAIFRCASCGFGVTRPAIDDVAVLYEGRESQDYQRGDGVIGAAIKRIVFAGQARGVLRQARFDGGHVIDYGCGSGVLSNAIADALSEGSRMTALDFFEAPPCAMPRAAYRSFAALPELAGSADLLTCFHALEHDDDPERFLDRLLALLKPGGTVVIEVPNMSCPWGRLFGRSWDNWYLPYHRVHFTRGTLRALVERRGLEVLLERDVHVPSFGRSAATALGMRNSLPFLLGGAAAFPLQWLGEKLSREPAALRIVARSRC
ncbi:MAG: class I SAM-dependent methyltransferase [Sphingomonadales bacterium]|nr:class I SAM-dependent methyltransferase [Sphingomonadales bacterium]MDE2569960.1 class I SAM-dependent methyltransferase [Sphingomonadales bacterium]